MCVCHDQYGRAALEAVLKAVTGQGSPLIPPPQDYKGHFFQGMLIFDLRDTDKSRYFASASFFSYVNHSLTAHGSDLQSGYNCASAMRILLATKHNSDRTLH